MSGLHERDGDAATDESNGRGTRRGLDVKVPEVTAWFWIVKILTTAMGEAFSDNLVHRMDPVVAVALGAVGFVLALGVQLAVRRYIPWVYWTAVAMVAVFGTMAADVLHIRFGVPYAASAVLFTLALVVVFTAWQRVEGTLSVHSICTQRREAFYWAAVLTTFALGTAVGDLTAYSLHLGFFSSGLLFAAVFAMPGVAWWRGRVGPVAAFWAAYVVTRPLGASFADWMGVPRDLGGLALGRGAVSFGLLALIAVLVVYLSVTKVDDPRRRRPEASAARISTPREHTR